MSAPHLEDFGTKVPSRTTPMAMASAADAATGAYEQGYNAGWDDALAQIAEEKGRIGETLAERLSLVEQTRDEAMAQMLRALEPLLNDVFDKVLPRAVDRGFLRRLLQEAEAVLEETRTPEEVAALDALVASRPDLSDVVKVKAEPALALSQAILAWEGGQKRLDLQSAMSALEAAFQDLTQTIPDTSIPKEAING
ncbi:MAG: hypothetical protein AAF366_09820 [Pseudomonadota bacterium]